MTLRAFINQAAQRSPNDLAAVARLTARAKPRRDWAAQAVVRQPRRPGNGHPSPQFAGGGGPRRKESILDTMARAPQHVMVAAFEGLRDYEPEAAPRLDVPALYIAADEPVPRADIGRLRALAPAMLYGQTVGAGHFCQLEVPGQVNAMIDRFLEVSGAASG